MGREKDESTGGLKLHRARLKAVTHQACMAPTLPAAEVMKYLGGLPQPYQDYSRYHSACQTRDEGFDKRHFSLQSFLALGRIDDITALTIKGCYCETIRDMVKATRRRNPFDLAKWFGKGGCRCCRTKRNG
jgi:hypothetical protein